MDTYYARKDCFDYITKIIELNDKDATVLTSDHKLFFLQFVIGLIKNSNSPSKDEGGEAPVE